MIETAVMDDKLRNRLRKAYNRQAQERENRRISSWKIQERENFLEILQREGKRSLLEIGAGTGKDAQFFQDSGMQVVCTDLSQEMVRLCRQKGLKAHVMDFAQLDLAKWSFDAVYALNSLLHVPKADLRRVLHGISAVLKPDGLFYMGVYGGYDFEGMWEEDGYEPKRFFSFYTDEHLREVLEGAFQIVSFKRIHIERDDSELHFQAFILRNQYFNGQINQGEIDERN